MLEEMWDETWGDRGTQLVVIGRGMDHDSMESELAACLLTDEEMTEDWSTYDDRFPVFELAEKEETAEGAEPEENSPAADEEATNEADGAEEIGIAD